MVEGWFYLSFQFNSIETIEYIIFIRVVLGIMFSIFSGEGKRILTKEENICSEIL